MRGTKEATPILQTTDSATVKIALEGKALPNTSTSPALEPAPALLLRRVRPARGMRSEVPGNPGSVEFLVTISEGIRSEQEGPSGRLGMLAA